MVFNKSSYVVRILTVIMIIIIVIIIIIIIIIIQFLNALYISLNAFT